MPNQQSYQFDRANAIAISGRKEEARPPMHLEKNLPQRRSQERARIQQATGDCCACKCNRGDGSSNAVPLSKKFMAASSIGNIAVRIRMTHCSLHFMETFIRNRESPAALSTIKSIEINGSVVWGLGESPQYLYSDGTIQTDDRLWRSCFSGLS
ncbi:hypothetical protein CS542_03550 [Pedobacter sp. IW39]|nr:hypothetical protein CS542_03550 [Pedobacter sp. IW39]